MTVVAILRAAPVVGFAEMDEPIEHFEAYAPDALYPRPGTELRDVPVRVDHDKSASIGWVTALRVAPAEWGGPPGRWQYVHVEIDDPPVWLRRGTPVSISRAAHSSRTPWGADWLHVQKAILTEVSLLSPGHEPAHPAACVEWLDTARPAVSVGGEAGMTSDRTSPPSTPVRRSRPARVIPEAELRRRLDFAADLEDAGLVGVIEAEILHMQRLERGVQTGRLPDALVAAVLGAR
jgi:hypothetical protein